MKVRLSPLDLGCIDGIINHFPVVFSSLADPVCSVIDLCCANYTPKNFVVFIILKTLFVDVTGYRRHLVEFQTEKMIHHKVK